MLPFDGDCAARCTELQTAAAASGSTRAVFDVMIGVSALVNDLPLATCNVRDSADIPGLEVLDWWE